MLTRRQLLVAAVSRSSVDTVYSADSLEFSPHHPAIFTVGTYQLEKPEEAGGAPATEPELMAGYDDDGNMVATPAAKRRGRCLVYETDGEGLYVLPHCYAHRQELTFFASLSQHREALCGGSSHSGHEVVRLTAAVNTSVQR